MPKEKPITLQMAMDEFLIACNGRRLSVHTIIDYKRTIKKLISHLGNVPIRDITTTQIAAFLSESC